MLKQVQHDAHERGTGALHIRDATEADLPAIIAMLADDVNGSGREDASLPLDQGYLAAFAAIQADPNQRLLVAEQAGALVGTFQLSFLPGLSYKGAWRAQIEAVRVASRSRGQGIGGQMLDWAIDQAKARDCRMMQLTSKTNRTDAHRFYERLGFVSSHVGMKLTLKD